MFSATAKSSHIQQLRDELAETQAEARRLRGEYHKVAFQEPPAVELAVAAVPEKHPRLRQDVALLRSWMDRKRIGDVRILLRGKPYLLDEYVRLGPNQTALEYAMAQDQDQGMQDIIAVLREAAGERKDKS